MGLFYDLLCRPLGPIGLELVFSGICGLDENEGGNQKSTQGQTLVAGCMAKS